MKKNYKILSLLILSVIVSLKLLAGTIKTNEENEQIFASKATAVIATGISKTSETTYTETFDLLPAEGWLNDNYILNNGISWAVNAKSEFKTRLGSGNSIYFFIISIFH